ncbi:MAG: hypothetical protein HC896_09060 [Bacteroidales bacterium]|nr:hypothetical protein [Bacteroidales bacterium]
MNRKLKRNIRFCIALFLVFVASCEVQDDFDSTFQIRQKILGSWTSEENSSEFGQEFRKINITSASDSVSIVLNNFFSSNSNVFATLSGRSIEIPRQDINGDIILGDGTISTDYKKININYAVEYETGEDDNVTAILTRDQ